ncbi:MAG: hypothetical protein AB1349_11395 [Elusimicrobiota bacterium]
MTGLKKSLVAGLQYQNFNVVRGFSLAILGLVFWVSSVFTATPQKINYQGKLEQSGTAVNGTKTITFKLYDALTGGNQLWSSGAQTVTVTNGLFNYVLGADVALSGLDWEGKTVYLELSVDGTTLSP